MQVEYLATAGHSKPDPAPPRPDPARQGGVLGSSRKRSEGRAFVAMRYSVAAVCRAGGCTDLLLVVRIAHRADPYR